MTQSRKAYGHQRRGKVMTQTTVPIGAIKTFGMLAFHTSLKILRNNSQMAIGSSIFVWWKATKQRNTDYQKSIKTLKRNDMYAIAFDLLVSDTEINHPKGVTQAYVDIASTQR